jgi:hypothetical protein
MNCPNDRISIGHQSCKESARMMIGTLKGKSIRAAVPELLFPHPGAIRANGQQGSLSHD